MHLSSYSMWYMWYAYIVNLKQNVGLTWALYSCNSFMRVTRWRGFRQRISTKSEICFITSAIIKAYWDNSTPSTKFSSFVYITCCAKAQLMASNSSLRQAPGVGTYSHPLSHCEKFYTTIKMSWSTSQPDGTIHCCLWSTRIYNTSWQVMKM